MKGIYTCTSAGFRSYSREQATFPSQGPHPADLRQCSLQGPVVFLPKELVRFSAEQRARICAHPSKPSVPEPTAHLADGVPVLFDVLVLIAHPGLAPPWIAPRHPARAPAKRGSDPRPPPRGPRSPGTG